jgi:hypothetical protein
MDDIVLFNECSIDDAKVIGKKAAFLAELASKGFSVPEGFIITGNLFVKFIELVGLKERIAEILISTQDVERKSLQIQQIILNADFPQDMAAFIYQNYQKLGSNENEPYVALRVSSTSDYIEDSFFLNIHGRERLISGIKSCWASVFSARNIDLKRFKPSVIIQKMINPGKSGYIYSYNPLTRNPNELFIQVCSGLGNAISLRQVLPSGYVIQKDSLIVLRSSLKEQTTQYTLSLQKERTEKVDLQEPVKNILDDFIMKELAKIASRVESRIKEPQRVTFAIDKSIHIIGTQPIHPDDFVKQYESQYQDLQAQEPQSSQPMQEQHQNDSVPEQEVQQEPQQHFQEPVQQSQQQDSVPEQQVQPEFQQQQPEQGFQQFEQPMYQQQQSQEPIQQQQKQEQQSQVKEIDDDSIFQHYEPEVHHAPEDVQPVQNAQQVEPHYDQHSSENVQHTPEQQYEQQQPQIQEEPHYVQQPAQQSPSPQQSSQESSTSASDIFSKAVFQASLSIVSCDLAISTALRKRYKELYYKEPPGHLEQLLNELKMKVQIPYEEDVRGIRRLRDTLLTYAKEPTGSEIHRTLTITKQFLNEF